MPKVYIVQETHINGRPLNYTDAQRFGDLELVLSKNYSVLNTAPTVAEIRKKLMGYTEEDFLIPTGDPINIAIASTIAARQTNGRINMLKYDRNSKMYMPVIINI